MSATGRSWVYLRSPEHCTGESGGGLGQSGGRGTNLAGLLGPESVCTLLLGESSALEKTKGFTDVCHGQV